MFFWGDFFLFWALLFATFCFFFSFFLGFRKANPSIAWCFLRLIVRMSQSTTGSIFGKVAEHELVSGFPSDFYVLPKGFPSHVYYVTLLGLLNKVILIWQSFT